MKPRNEIMASISATASWTAPALGRFHGRELLATRTKSGSGLPQPKTSRKFGNCILAALCATFVTSSVAAALPPDWQQEQRFDVAAPGIVKFSLPAETLNAARPALEDLRLYDNAGNELPFFIERPAPVAKVVQPAKSFQVSLNANTTVITLETGLAQPLDGVAPRAIRREPVARGGSAGHVAPAAAHRGRLAHATGSVHRRAGFCRRHRNDADGTSTLNHHRAE